MTPLTIILYIAVLIPIILSISLLCRGYKQAIEVGGRCIYVIDFESSCLLRLKCIVCGEIKIVYKDSDFENV